MMDDIDNLNPDENPDQNSDLPDDLNQETAAGAPGQHLQPDDLFLYTLELLSPEEASHVEAHLRECAQCRQELTTVREDVGIYALAMVPMVDAPAKSRERLLAAVAAETPKRTPELEAGGSLRTSGDVPPQTSAGPLPVLAGGRAASTNESRRTGWAGWVGWAVAAALAIAAVHFYQGRQAMQHTLATQTTQIAELAADEARARQTVVHLSAEEARARQIVDALVDRSAQRITLTSTPTHQEPYGRATYVASKGTLIFVASHLAPLAADKTYELWLLPADGTAPVPAGIFRPDERGNASVVTAKLRPAVAAKGFGVTVEGAGGASAPTPPILLSGS